MFIEKRCRHALQSRRDDMFMEHISNKYAVPTELKRGSALHIYKHCVPTGLKSR